MNNCKSGLNGNRNSRQSNVESLRILAMSMILIHHFIVHGLMADNLTDRTYAVINCLVYSGVDIFFFISGYFLIKFSVYRTIKFLLTVSFFVAVNGIILYFGGHSADALHCFIKALFPANGYWFVTVYFLLMLTAPIINSGLKSLSNRQLALLSCALLIAINYANGICAHSNYLNGLLLYILGNCASKINLKNLFSARVWLAIFLIASSVMMILQYVYMTKYNQPLEYLTYYSNFLIVAATVSLSLCFMYLNFKSKIVNSIAGAALGCYLLQDGLLGQRWIYGGITRVMPKGLTAGI